MLSIIIAVLIGAGAGTAVGIDLQSTPWGITCGLAGYVITQIIISTLRKLYQHSLHVCLQITSILHRNRLQVA